MNLFYYSNSVIRIDYLVANLIVNAGPLEDVYIVNGMGMRSQDIPIKMKELS